MAAKGERSFVQLDWFNVTYSSVLRYGILILLALLTGGGYWYYTALYAPRSEADAVIGGDVCLTQSVPPYTRVTIAAP